MQTLSCLPEDGSGTEQLSIDTGTGIQLFHGKAPSKASISDTGY